MSCKLSLVFFSFSQCLAASNDLHKKNLQASDRMKFSTFSLLGYNGKASINSFECCLKSPDKSLLFIFMRKSDFFLLLFALRVFPTFMRSTMTFNWSTINNESDLAALEQTLDTEDGHRLVVVLCVELKFMGCETKDCCTLARIERRQFEVEEKYAGEKWKTISSHLSSTKKAIEDTERKFLCCNIELISHQLEHQV